MKEYGRCMKVCTLSCKIGIRCLPSNPKSTYKSGQVLNLIAVYNDLPKRFLSAQKMNPSCNGRYWHICPVHVKKKWGYIQSGKMELKLSLKNQKNAPKIMIKWKKNWFGRSFTKKVSKSFDESWWKSMKWWMFFWI
jgi:hypothetical protein